MATQPKKFKIKDPDAKLSPAQAKWLWAFEIRHSATSPIKWFNADLTKQQASDIISLCSDVEKDPRSRPKQETAKQAIRKHNPLFKWKSTEPKEQAPEPIVETKEVIKTVSITQDMDIAQIIEAIYPVVKGASIIQDLYDSKPIPLPKAPKTKGYFKPSNFDYIYASIQTNNNVLLTGPSGCGKSKMAEVMADMLSLPYFVQDCSENTTMLDLKGSTGIKDGDTEFQFSGLMLSIQKPGLTLIDEIYSLEPKVLIGLNGLFEPNCRSVQTKGGLVKMHKDHILMCASNLNGRNLDRNHVGANRVDGSSLDRVVTFACDYSAKAERSLSNVLPKIQRETLLHWLTELRKGVKLNNIAFAPSTRRLISCIALIQGNLPLDIAFQASFLGQLSTAELKKVKLDKLNDNLPEFKDDAKKEKLEWQMLVDKGRKIEALKAYRTLHGCDLKEAQKQVDIYLHDKAFKSGIKFPKVNDEEGNF